MPERAVVLYDGNCAFCTTQSRRLLRMAAPGAIELRDFQQPGALDEFPGVTHDACMEAMHVVLPDGRVYRGFEAAVRAVATRAVLGKLAYVYYVPGVRQLCDAVYRWIARRRYRIAVRECADGSCELHRPR